MNMQQIQAQAQRMQRDIMEKKGKIDSTEFIGKSEWVEVTFKGNKEIVNVNITKDEALNVENKDILCDMLMLAIKDAMKKIDDEVESKLGYLSKMGGLF